MVCVLRRGPTAWYHVALWHTDRRTVAHGSWLRGRLYPERCGLSPDGLRLAYFALAGGWGSYFAVSRAPWLHALAAWGTMGTWTTGARFTRGGELVLAGACGTTPLRGRYPGTVRHEGVDTRWGRARLYRELHTGWTLEDRDADWIADLPVPLDARPAAVVASRPSPAGSGRSLVVVTDEVGPREYYVRRDDGSVVDLPDLAWAEWSRSDRGKVVAATRSGHLQVLDEGYAPAWSYDMNPFEPAPEPPPPEALDW